MGFGCPPFRCVRDQSLAGGGGGLGLSFSEFHGRCVVQCGCRCLQCAVGFGFELGPGLGFYQNPNLTSQSRIAAPACGYLAIWGSAAVGLTR